MLQPWIQKLFVKLWLGLRSEITIAEKDQYRQAL